MEMMHGNDWTGQDVTSWYASEKLHGWRARWTGERLLTRSGLVYPCPKSFTRNLPDVELDCEVHLGRGHDENDVHRAIAAKEWGRLIVTAFDVPGLNTESAIEYLSTLKCDTVEFIKVESIEHAKALRDDVKANQGEGIMLRKPGTDYLPYRCDVLLKMK